VKTGSVAHKLGIKSPKTVINWTDMYSDFFSEGARRSNGLQRDYDHDDLIVLNTIRTERQRDSDWEAIRAALAAGYRDTNLPMEATVIEGENAMAVYGQIRVLEASLATANAELERLRSESKAEIERLHIENESLRKQHKEHEEQLIREAKEREAQLLRDIREREAQLANDIKQLNTEIKELFGEVGAWRARFEMLKERLDENDKHK